MEEGIEIALLTGHGHLARLLAQWHVAEFGKLYREEVWNLESAVREFVAMAEAGSIDRTWVAFEGSGRTAADVLGSVSLLGSDDLDGFEHLSPWLASFFVAPRARGRGTALAETVLREARARGHSHLYLFTAGSKVTTSRAVGARSRASSQTDARLP